MRSGTKARQVPRASCRVGYLVALLGLLALTQGARASVFTNAKHSVMAEGVWEDPKDAPVSQQPQSTSDNHRVAQSTGIVPYPENLVRPGIHNNSFIVVLPAGQSRVVSDVVVSDLYNGKLYSCKQKQLGCKLSFVAEGFVVSFDTDVRVPLADLIVYRTLSRLLVDGETRVLQDTSTFRIKNVAIMKGSWLTTAAYVLQILVYIFRLPFSVFLFWKYPYVSLLMDQVATHFTVLSLFRGPFVALPEVVLQMVAHTKVLPFFFKNPFEQWDASSVRCATKPLHSSHDLYCDFLDNYGQNVIALAGIALVTTLIHFCLAWALKSSKVTGKTRKFLFIVRKYYGPMFLVAKLDANHIEIILFSLINYSVTDKSSSKWIVGVCLSCVMFLALLCYSGLVTFTNLQIFKLRKGTAKVLPVAGQTLETEVHAIDSDSDRKESAARVNGSHQPTHTDPQYFQNPWKRLTQHVHQNTQEPQKLWGIFLHSAKYLRSIGLCVLVLNDIKSPVTQLLIAIAIESVYLAYMILANNKLAPLEYTTSWLLQLLGTVYLIMKVISTDVTLSLTEVHWTNAWVMTGLLSAIVVFGLVVCILSIFGIWFPQLFFWTKEVKRDLVVYLDVQESPEVDGGKLELVDSKTSNPVLGSQKPDDLDDPKESKVEAVSL